MIRLGDIQLGFGDCLKLMMQIPDNSINLVLADPPFGTTRCKWDSIIDLKLMWEQLTRITKDSTPIILFAQTPFDKVLGSSNLRDLRYEWIWEKPLATGHFNANKMPMKAHENLLVFYKKLPYYNPIKTNGHKPMNQFTKNIEMANRCKIYDNGTKTIKGGGATVRYPRSVLKYSSDKQKSNLHSTQKPVALLKYMVETYSRAGDTVLDFCMGSGSTGIPCVETGRKFIGIDNDINNYDTALIRLITHIMKRIKS